MKTKFKDLTIDEKIQIATDYHYYQSDRRNVARYLWALRKNDIGTLSYFENMGDDFHHIIQNIRTYERAKLWGFNELNFNEHGWLEYRLDIVSITEVYKSEILVGKPKKDLFTYGVYYNFGNSGGGWFPNIWGKIFNSEHDTKMAGIDFLKEKMKEGLIKEKDDTCNYSIHEIKNTLKEIDRIRFESIQLNIF